MLNMRQNSPIRPFFPSSLFQQIRALISRNRIANQLLEIITLGLEAAVRSPSQSVAGENPTLREHSMGKAGSARSEGRATLWLLMATALLFALGFTFGRALPSWPSGDPNWSSQLEANRGRFATTPSEISTRGWKDILLRVYENIFEHRVMAIAAGVTFYALLAIFPAIAALVSIYGLFADPATISSQLDVIADFVPSGAVDIMREELSRLTTQGKAVLGVGFVVGLAISLWSANSGINALFDALNIVYSEKEKRSFIKLYALTLGFTTGAIAFLLIALAAVVGIPIVLNYIGLAGSTDLLVRMLRWPILFVCITVALVCIYRLGPSRTTAQWRWITWGSVIAGILWIAASLLFSWYAANFGSFNKTYGSLGAAIGFMTWIWISTIIVLIGAEIGAEMEHQTAHDTTTGRPKPIGRRGAVMADTLGEARK